jgi:hypothetical protein
MVVPTIKSSSCSTPDPPEYQPGTESITDGTQASPTSWLALKFVMTVGNAVQQQSPTAPLDSVPEFHATWWAQRLCLCLRLTLGQGTETAEGALMWCRLPNAAVALSSAEPLECQAVAVPGTEALGSQWRSRPSTLGLGFPLWRSTFLFLLFTSSDFVVCPCATGDCRRDAQRAVLVLVMLPPAPLTAQSLGCSELGLQMLLSWSLRACPANQHGVQGFRSATRKTP